MSLIEKLIKSTKVEGSSLFETSEVIDPVDLFTTECPAINVAGTGKLDGKFKSGFFQIVGPSKHYKSKYALLMVSSYLKQNPDAICVFYDTEFGASREYFNDAGIDTNKVIHIPLENIEEFKFDIIDKLKNQIKRGDKVIFFIDSIGNMASKKEIEDTLEEKGTVDMTRAKMLKSVMRMAIPLLNKRGVMLVGINHVYQSQGFIPTTVVSGGTGLYFGANDIWLVSRSQEKEGKDLKGYTFKLKIEKSRTTKEGSVVPITVLFDGGIQLDSGLLEWARESGHVTGTGWYQRVDMETGEILGQKLRESALTMEFWEPILNCPKFKEFVSKKYLLC